MCGCGKTESDKGFCDGSHAKPAQAAVVEAAAPAKCACGKTSDPAGNCDGSHAKKMCGCGKTESDKGFCDGSHAKPAQAAAVPPLMFSFAAEAAAQKEAAEKEAVAAFAAQVAAARKAAPREAAPPIVAAQKRDSGASEAVFRALGGTPSPLTAETGTVRVKAPGEQLASFMERLAASKPEELPGALLGALRGLLPSGLLPGAAKPEEVAAAKAELLAAVDGLQRGVTASAADKQRVEEAARALEALNADAATLRSPLINGKWELLYTTSASILGTSRPAPFRPSGPIFQTIDVAALRAKNQEGAPFYNSVTAELTPTSASAVKVQFKAFRILGTIPITAPPSAVGSLDTTFLDREIRISRGDRGNLFILRQADRSARLSEEQWP